MMTDHYRVLGLPSGEKGRKLTDREIKKAYKLKALRIHPDKSRFDPNAVDKFQKLKSSYECLLNEKTRRAFDDLLLRTRQREEDRNREKTAATSRQREEDRNREKKAAASQFSRRTKEEVDWGKFEEESAKFREEIARFEANRKKMEGTTYYKFKFQSGIVNVIRLG